VELINIVTHYLAEFALTAEEGQFR